MMYAQHAQNRKIAICFIVTNRGWVVIGDLNRLKMARAGNQINKKVPPF